MIEAAWLNLIFFPVWIGLFVFGIISANSFADGFVDAEYRHSYRNDKGPFQAWAYELGYRHGDKEKNRVEVNAKKYGRKLSGKDV